MGPVTNNPAGWLNRQLGKAGQRTGTLADGRNRWFL